ncbi:MAG TPA: rhodanese-like domain-containing protein [Verrucomicrobiales bacterium]|nr:rhodanese-like domain-containing protein [Verrucomicrobiales bacterium]
MRTESIARIVSVLLTTLLVGLVQADQHAKKEPVKHVEAEAADKLLKENPKIVVLDIRTPREFAAGHIKDAKNIDFYADDFAAQIGKLDREKSYLVHCASGGRSGKSLELFQKLGFKSVFHLDGGFKGWEKAGKGVEK